MNFVLVVQGDVEGRGPDAGLSATGRRQARALAAQLGAKAPGATLLCGPRRAMQETAAAIAAAVNAASPDTRVELAEPEDASEETLARAREQAWCIIEDAKSALAAEGNLVMVTHELIVRLLVCRALGIPTAEMGRFVLDPGSMSTIEWRTQPRERLLVASLNEVCHLERRPAKDSQSGC